MTEEAFDLIVIGSGPGGYVAAIKAAQLGLKTACVEKEAVLGGTCLNVGCIPSKSLLQSSESYQFFLHHAKEHGIEYSSLKMNFAQMMERKEKVVKGFNQGIGALFKKNKVTAIQGVASFENPHEISVTTHGQKTSKNYQAKCFIIATGSVPIPLPFLPFDEQTVLSSTGVLSLQKPPKKLLVVGAGIIGVELGSVYSRLGTEVIFLEFLNRICPTLDLDLSKALQKSLEKQGLQFFLNTKVLSGAISSQGITLEAETQSKREKFQADKVLVAIGRKPYTEGLQLERIGITVTSKGLIPIDANFRTTQHHILAIGDVVDGPMLAHKAEDEGIAAAEILAGVSPKIEYMAIPSVVYTHPEVGAVGLSQEAALARGLKVKTAMFPLKANSRAKCMGDDEGFVKMIAEEHSLQILGVHIMGPHAGELIAEGVLAIHQKMRANDLASISHAHPTLSEALKEAALMLQSKAIHM